MNEYHLSLFEEDGYTVSDRKISKEINIKNKTIKILYENTSISFFQKYFKFDIYLDYLGIDKWVGISSLEYDFVKSIIDCSLFLFNKFNSIHRDQSYTSGIGFATQALQVNSNMLLRLECIEYYPSSLHIKATISNQIIWDRVIKLPELE